MIVTRSALMLHLQNPPIRYHFFSHFSYAPTFPTLFKPRPFSPTTPRQAQTRTFVSAVASSSSAAHGSNGRDTFFAEENVSWSSLGLSDTISRALSNIGLNRPSLVQVPFLSFFLFFFPTSFLLVLSVHLYVENQFDFNILSFSIFLNV